MNLLGFVAIFLFILVLDQVTKFLVVSQMRLQESIPVIPNFFHITYLRNPGAAFGLFAYQTAFFVVVTIFLIIFIVFYCRRIPLDHVLLKIGLALHLGGAVGNLLDRLRTGYVIDFIDFRVWPVFNIADMAIVIGMVLIVYDLWRRQIAR